jgi:hypothetical protein
MMALRFDTHHLTLERIFHCVVSCPIAVMELPDVFLCILINGMYMVANAAEHEASI